MIWLWPLDSHICPDYYIAPSDVINHTVPAELAPSTSQQDIADTLNHHQPLDGPHSPVFNIRDQHCRLRGSTTMHQHHPVEDIAVLSK